MSKFALKIAAKLQKKPEISLIICTHNRADLLNQSLAHYASISTTVPFEILVVLNACNDNSLEVVTRHQQQIKNLNYVIEHKIGHSNARNAGWQHAKAPFVFYMDDDAYPDNQLVDILSTHLTNHNIVCISGHTKYWSANSPQWIKPELVEVPLFRNDFGPLPEAGYINGCACGFNVESLQKNGGFNPDVGMKGNKLGYYDEIYLQDKLRSQGETIYYDPNLIVYHQSHQKTTLSFLKAAYAKGKSKKLVRKRNVTKLLAHTSISLIMATIRLPFMAVKLGGRHAIIHEFKEPFRLAGQLF